MTHPNKIKGNNFERAIVNHAREQGFKATRAYASDGRSLGLSEGVDCVVDGVAIQCKIKKKLPNWLQLPKGVDIVAIRENRGQPLVLIPYFEWLKLRVKHFTRILPKKIDSNNVNQAIINAVAARLAHGQKIYGKSLPLNDGRDFTQETMEEVVDAVVYAMAKLLQIQKFKTK